MKAQPPKIAHRLCNFGASLQPEAEQIKSRFRAVWSASAAAGAAAENCTSTL